MSLTFVEEELGVAVLELLGDLESPPTAVDEAERGEAVPEFESFFLEDLLESFARDSCSCCSISELECTSNSKIGIGMFARSAAGVKQPPKVRMLYIRLFA